MTDKHQEEESSSVLAGVGDVEVKDEANACEKNSSKEGGSGDDDESGDISLSFGRGEDVQSENMGEESVAVESATAPQLSRKELLEAVGAQLEELFSLSSLKAGTFSASNMNVQMCVPVDVIAQMSQIRAITVDEGIILEAAEARSACIVTPNGIRPNVRSERNTIILRDLPSNTDPRRVEAIFKDAGMEVPISVRADVGDTWFVTFKTEDDAMKSILELRGSEFEGNPIKARLKSENLLRSIFPQTSTNASGNNVAHLNPTTVPPSVVNLQQQSSFLPPGAVNNPQAVIPPAVMAPYPMRSGPVQPQIGSLFTGQMNRGPPAPFSAGLNNPRPLPPGSPALPQGRIPAGTYRSPVMDSYAMQGLLPYSMVPQQPVMRQWRGRMGGGVNRGVGMGQFHTRHVSLGQINGGGNKNAGRGRHFQSASMPGNIFMPPAGVFFNPMSGYGAENAPNKVQGQPYQRPFSTPQYNNAGGVQGATDRDKVTNPSRGAKSRNRGRGGRNVVDRGRRSHVVGDAEMSGGNGKLRGGSSMFSNDNAKQPDLSSSAHFPPLPGQDSGSDTAIATDNSELGGGLGSLLSTRNPARASRLSNQRNGGEVSPAPSSLSDDILIELSNEGDGGIGGGCVKGSGISELEPCSPTSCVVTTSSNISANSGSGGGDSSSLSHESKVGQNKRVEGDLGFEVSSDSAPTPTTTLPSTSGGDKEILQADGTPASPNIKVSENVGQNNVKVELFSNSSQEGSPPATKNPTTTSMAKKTEEVKSIELPPVFGAYAAALMKKNQVKVSNPDGKTLPGGKDSTGKPSSGTKSKSSTQGGDTAAAAAVVGGSTPSNEHDQLGSSSITTSDENCKRGGNNNDKKGYRNILRSGSNSSSKSGKSPSSERRMGGGGGGGSIKKESSVVFGKDTSTATKLREASGEEPDDGAVRDKQGNRMNILQPVAVAAAASGTTSEVAAAAASSPSSFCDQTPNSVPMGVSAWGKRSFLDAVMAQPPQKSA